MPHARRARVRTFNYRPSVASTSQASLKYETDAFLRDSAAYDLLSSESLNETFLRRDKYVRSMLAVIYQCLIETSFWLPEWQFRRFAPRATSGCYTGSRFSNFAPKFAPGDTRTVSKAGKDLRQGISLIANWSLRRESRRNL